MMNNVFISPKFHDTLLTHIVCCYIKNSPFPQFIAIHGKKGEGKTFQTIECCKKFNINFEYFSGAELSGSYESDSIARIEDAYKKCLNNYRSNSELGAIIIDDFHLSVASVGKDISKTVNSQILTGWLMNISDKSSREGVKIPIIILGNDFVDVYAPLKREGRMDFFEWNPEIDEKRKIVRVIFEDIIYKSNQNFFDNFFEQYSTQSISFFREIKNDLYKNIIFSNFKLFQGGNLKDFIDNLDLFNLLKLDENIGVVIDTLARNRISSQRGSSILHEERWNH